MEPDLTTEILEELNRVSVTGNDLDRVLHKAEKLHKGGKAEAGGGIFLIASMFRGSPQKAQAIYFRMLGLAEILQEQELPGWAVRRPEGLILTKSELIKAAALCPLTKVGEHKIGFDRESLLAKALELADAEGRS